MVIRVAAVLVYCSLTRGKRARAAVESLLGLPWNGRSLCCGIRARFAVESLLVLLANTHSGYTVEKIDSIDGMSYELDFADKSKNHLNGGMTLCKGLVASVNRGLEPDTYPLVLNRLFSIFGQPKARIGTLYTKQGAMSYATLVWDVGSIEISLSDMPPNDAIVGMASHRDVRLGFDDLSQSCFYDVRRDPAIQTWMAPRDPMTFSMPR